MTDHKKLLITGINGFLGWTFCRQSEGWQIHGTVYSHVVEIPGVNVHEIDLRDTQKVTTLFEHVRPDAVIHTAAISAPNVCQLNPGLSHAVNVEASVNVARLCAESGIPLVLTSTDLVFDGRNPPYDEADPVCPVSTYGQHKVLAEEQVLSIHPHASVCRLPLLFGISGPVQKGIVPLLADMKSGKRLQFFIDEYRTPVSNRTAARGVLLAVGNVEGILHLGGPERISRFEFAQRLAEIFKVNESNIDAVSLADVDMAVPRVPDVSLNSRLAEAIGYRPPKLADELTALAAQLAIGEK